MTYQLITTLDSPNYTPGREGHPITGIVIHHWGADGQSHDGVAQYLCRPGGGTSAHYVASAGRVTCIVDPDDTAWHAGNWSRNLTTIGIECRPEMSDADIQTVAELISDLRAAYGWLPLLGHRDIIATTCPGRWYPTLTSLSMRADQITAGTPTPPAPQPVTPTTPKGIIEMATYDDLEKSTRQAALAHLEILTVQRETDPTKYDYYIANFDTMTARLLTSSDAATILSNRGVHTANPRTKAVLADFTIVGA